MQFAHSWKVIFSFTSDQWCFNKDSATRSSLHLNEGTRQLSPTERFTEYSFVNFCSNQDIDQFMNVAYFWMSL